MSTKTRLEQNKARGVSWFNCFSALFAICVCLCVNYFFIFKQINSCLCMYNFIVPAFRAYSVIRNKLSYIPKSKKGQSQTTMSQWLCKCLRPNRSSCNQRGKSMLLHLLHYINPELDYKTLLLMAEGCCKLKIQTKNEVVIYKL